MCILKNFTPIHVHETDRFCRPLVGPSVLCNISLILIRVLCIPIPSTEVEVRILKNFTPIYIYETDRFCWPLCSELSVVDLPYSYTRII